MKHLYVFLLLLIFSKAGAQCTPDSSNLSPGTHPTALAQGCISNTYSDTVTLVAPADTTVTVPPFGTITIPFDSLLVINVLNLPAGITHSCTPASCHVVAPGSGQPLVMCLLFSGTPTTPSPANDSLGIVVEAWVTVLGSPQPFTDTIMVATNMVNCVGITDHAAGRTGAAYPNPAGDFLNISWNDFQPGHQPTIQLFNALGARVYSETMTSAKQTLETISLPDGIYFLKIEDGEKVYSEKIILQRR